MDEAPDQPPVAEDLLCALVVALLQKGAITEIEWDAATRDLNDEARRVALSLILEADQGPVADFQAELRRDGLTVIDGGKG